MKKTNEQTTLSFKGGRTEPERFRWKVEKCGRGKYLCSCPRCGWTIHSKNGKAEGLYHYCLFCGAWLEDDKE